MKYHKWIITVLLTLTLACNQSEEKDVVLVYVESPEERALINFWKEFSLKFNAVDTATVKKISLDTIWLWGDRVSSADFIQRYAAGYTSSDFSKIILDTNKTCYSSIGCHPSPPVEGAIRQQNADAFRCETVAINDTSGPTVQTLEFSFLQTTSGRRLFGIKNYSYRWEKPDPMVDTIRAE